MLSKTRGGKCYSAGNKILSRAVWTGMTAKRERPRTAGPIRPPRHAASRRRLQPGALARRQRPRRRGHRAGGVRARVPLRRRLSRQRRALVAADDRAEHSVFVAEEEPLAAADFD